MNIGPFGEMLEVEVASVAGKREAKPSDKEAPAPKKEPVVAAAAAAAR